MRHGIPTVLEASNPEALYFRPFFSTFLYGPFLREAQIVAALRRLDLCEPYWDRDGWMIHHGARLPPDARLDHWFCLPPVREEIRERIQIARRQRPLPRLPAAVPVTQSAGSGR